jgi:hypothetical protein
LDDRRSAKIKDGAVTGAKVDLSTLGTVPSATHAATADKATSATTADRAAAATSADKATSADDAAKLNGLSSGAFATSASVFKPGFVKLSAGQTAALGQSGPFTLTAGCQDVGGGEVDARRASASP